jgi:hypothetical protein
LPRNGHLFWFHYSSFQALGEGAYRQQGDLISLLIFSFSKYDNWAKNIAEYDRNQNPEILAPNAGYTLKMATARCSEMSTDSYLTTRYHAKRQHCSHLPPFEAHIQQSTLIQLTNSAYYF